MKRILYFCLAICVAMAGMSVFAADTQDLEFGVQVTIDGETVDFPDQQPVILNGRTLVPVRGVFEKLGAEVSYLEEADAVQIVYEDITIDFPIGSQTVTVTTGGSSTVKTLDAPTVLLADRTMVPLRFVAETIGAEVLWEEESKTVVIETSPSADLPEIEMGEIQTENRFSAGRNNLAAVKDDGSVWISGKGDYGQLGPDFDTTAESSDTFVQISGIDKVIAVACGKNTIYALRSDGTVWSWGSNAYGALGTGSTEESSAVPTQVEGLTDIVSLSAGESHVLALDESGNLYAWGSNRRGQLGTGNTENQYTPVQIDGLHNVSNISAGSDHSCAIVDGDVYTWGGNGYQQLGISRNVSYLSEPQKITEITKLVSVKAGSTFTLAVRTDGSIYEWGTVYVGEQGDDDEENIADEDGYLLIEEPIKMRYIYQEELDGPYMMRVMTYPDMLACGDMHAVALKDKTVYAWGDSDIFRPREKNQTFRIHAFPYLEGDYQAVYAGKEGEIYALDEQNQLWQMGISTGRQQVIDLGA